MRRAAGTGALLGLLLAGPAPADEAARLAALGQEVWAFRLESDPLFATGVGDHSRDDRLPDLSPAALARRAAFAQEALARLRALDRSALPPGERLNAAVLERQLQDELTAREFGLERIPILADDGFHLALAQLPRQMRFDTPADYERYLARLRAVPAYFDQNVAHLRAGLRDGFTQSRAVLEGYEQGISAHVVADPETSVFYEPFRNFPPGVPEAQREGLRAAGRAAIREAVVPAYARFLDFFVRQYRPGARTSTGCSDLPRGRELYARLVKGFTTLDLAPEEVHATGLREVARIEAEMQAAMRKAGFQGALPAFLELLRTDPRFYARTPEELLMRAAAHAKRMDGALPALFGRLPRAPYGVEPVPDSLAPKYTGGRYVEASPGSTRAALFWVNTYALDTRPLYVLEALTLHEAVPGHHLQIALQQELEGLPPYRRVADVTAFVEGWALYAERLGLEAGFYRDPYSDFGRLTYEMWRACRLVVDTGLHSQGWTRQQARDYLAAHTALSLHEVATETDRYVSWPGQALAYKVGELKIRALRAQAEAELGPRFDLRRFHDAVLAQGAIPLGALEEQVEAFVKAEKERP